MTIERALRLIAGTVILISLILAFTLSQWFYLLTIFVAVNLIQSAFTNWCPVMVVLKKVGLHHASPAGDTARV